jgi:putative hemolysin
MPTEPILIEIGVIALLIVANGAFSLSEMALVFSKKARLRQAADSGDQGARAALELREDPNRFLSVIQVGITLVGTMAGVFGGATIAEHLAGRLDRIPMLAGYGEAIGLAIVVVGIGYFTLVFGELVPKRLALAHSEQFAAVVSRPLKLLSFLGIPLVKLLSLSTDLILHFVRVDGSKAAPVTAEEIKLMVEEGVQKGVFETVEHDLVRRVLRLDDLKAKVLMTQRSDIVWIDADGPPDDVRRKVTESPHSRFPVCEGSIDRVLGIVQAKDLLSRGLEGQALGIHGLLKMPLFIFETMTGLKVLEMLRGSSAPMAIVLDEYGAVVGVLTLTDILEAIVGQIPTEHGPGEPVAVERGDGSWLLDGTLTIAELRDLIRLPELPEGKYETLAGFILLQLGRIPQIGDCFEWGGHAFEIVDMDENRIDRVQVSPVIRRGLPTGERGSE